MTILRFIHSLLFCGAIATCHAVSPQVTDSVWHDSITGTLTHLQQVDTLAPYTCSLHFFGKKPDGSPKAPALQALVEDFSINALVLGWDYYIQRRDWARVTRHHIKRNLTEGWVWDSDSFSGNQFAHPYHGSMFYNAARQHGLSYGVSLLYPLAGSFTWEVFCETNRPAYNDLLSTGIGGAAIGEVTHRVSDIFFDNTKRGPERVVREFLGTLVNPVRGLHRIISGEMFHVNPFNAGKREQPMPYSFQIGAGNRYIYDIGPTHPNTEGRFFGNVPFLDIHFNYGDHFNHLDLGKSPRAYDCFDLYMLFNFAPDHPTIGELDLRGRIGSIQRQLPHKWKLDISFNQNIRYIDHYNKHDEDAPGNLPLISEAASFGAGFYAQRQGRLTTLTHDFTLNAVPLSGSAADYFTMRRYNFGTGFSTRYRFQFTLNRRFTVGNDFYFMRLFILKGTEPRLIQQYLEDPEKHAADLQSGTVAWGDKGEQSILQNRAFLQVNLIHNLQLHLQHEFNLRHGNYRLYPSLTGKSHEWHIGIRYAL